MQYRDDRFSLWFPFGLLLGATLASLVFLSSGDQNFAKWITDNQIIVGSVIAILTALWTIRSHTKSSDEQIRTVIDTTNQQILVTQTLEDTRRQEKLRAARAMLPFALTEVVGLSEGTISDLSAILSVTPVLDYGEVLVLSGGASFTPRPIPVSALDRIKELIETAPPQAAVELGRLLANVQIFTARLGEIEKWNATGFSDPGKSLTIMARVIDMFELYAQANRFFDYGRLKTDTVLVGPTLRSEILHSRSVMKVLINDDRLDALIDRRFPT